MHCSSLIKPTSIVFAMVFSWSLPLASSSPGNSVVITDLTGSSQINRPFTISRVFTRGEIAAYAQPSIGGNPLTTWQCDRKSTWSDGSLKHAMISFKTTIGANASVTVSFINTTSSSSSGSALTQQQMLDFDAGGGTGSWGATTDLTNGTTQTTNSRTMLAAGAWRYWLRGPVVTQVIVEDRTSSLAYDLGWDAYKSLHPIFVLTFCPGWAGVKVEYIIEDMWTTKSQDQAYSLVLKAGSPLAQVFSKVTFTQIANTRWRQTCWSGTQPGNVKVDLNLPYIISTKAIPNYDLTKTVSQTAINADVSHWNSSDKPPSATGMFGEWTDDGIPKNGFYRKVLSAPGGTEDRGILPAWAVRYLYTFDPSLLPILVGNGEVSGYLPFHYREATTGKWYDSGHTVDAFGKIWSIDAWPSAFYAVGRPFSCAGTCSGNNWAPDTAHLPDFAYLPYLITGDWYFLEELYTWANYAAAWGNPDDNTWWCRHSSWGIQTYDSQERGRAWGMRTMAEAAYAAPDGSAEKAYFTEKVNYNIAATEGFFGITTGSFNGTAAWTWGNTVQNHATPSNSGSGWVGGSNPPRIFGSLISTGYYDGLDSTKVNWITAPWMNHFALAVYGHVEELGFPMQTLRKELAKYLLHELVDPDFNPWLVQAYHAPATVPTSNGWFQTWSAMLAAFTNASGYWGDDPKTLSHWIPSIAGTNDPDGYMMVAFAASSFVADVTDTGLNGQDAWNWMKQNVVNQTILNDDPRWAILPRTAARPRTCDLNGDGKIDILDVQLVLNQALGVSPCTTGDLDGNGQCNIIDVQRVITSASGGPCKVGP